MRSRTSGKAAGARMESLVAAYLAEHVDDRIERRARNGRRDRGDISGLRHMGGRVVVEVKNCACLELSKSECPDCTEEAS